MNNNNNNYTLPTIAEDGSDTIPLIQRNHNHHTPQQYQSLLRPLTPSDLLFPARPPLQQFIYDRRRRPAFVLYDAKPAKENIPLNKK